VVAWLVMKCKEYILAPFVTQVRGVAAKLFTVRDEMFCQALNTAAGGRLYNVVVDTAEVSRQTLKFFTK